MLLLISDANILIDMEVGELLEPMFRLQYQFSVPDVLFHEELADRHAHLVNKGLQAISMAAELVRQVETMAHTYTKTSRNDLFALVLAEHKQCPLLSGDKALRQAAEKVGVEVRGVLWLVEELVKTQHIDVQTARNAYKRMRLRGSRLPWDLAEQRLREFE